jgi:hypothetical protein
MSNMQERTLQNSAVKKDKTIVKVSGFTIVRNVINYDYPVVEAIQSVFPLCDEFVIAAGKSDDDTLRLMHMVADEKTKVIETVWDDSLREGGKVLANETDKAFAAIAPDSDWAFYIQADEVLHEDSIPVVQEAMRRYKDDPEVEGLLFNYKHFYGTYNYVGDSRQWYRKEIRVIKNDKSISSYRDAQGFRKNGRKLNVKEIDAWIYHYGWVKPPDAQQAKQQTFHRMWHDDQWMNKHIPKVAEFDYSKIDSLQPFKGTHPRYMHARVEAADWTINYDPAKKKLPLKLKILLFIEKKWGWRIGEYKNYKIC